MAGIFFCITYATQSMPLLLLLALAQAGIHQRYHLISSQSEVPRQLIRKGIVDRLLRDAIESKYIGQKAQNRFIGVRHNDNCGITFPQRAGKPDCGHFALMPMCQANFLSKI